MAHKFKNIVLLYGLHPISEYHFKMIKSLLSRDLKLTKRKQDKCDKVEFAELMEKKFRKDAGLGKLLSLFNKMPDLESIVDTLKTEKAKVVLKIKHKGKRKNAVKRSKQDESSAVHSALTTDEESVEPESKDVPLSKKKKKSTKKMDDLKKSMADQKMSLLPETSTASTSLQLPHKPPPTSSSSSCTQMPSTPPTTLQTPQMAPETPSSSQQMPKMAPEPCNRLHTVRMLPAAASSSLQTAQRPPKPPSNLRPLWMPPTASSNLQTPLTTLPSSLQTPETPTTPTSSVQVLWWCPKTLSSGLQNPQAPLVPSSSLQTPQTPLASFCSLQTPQKPLATSSSLQNPQKPLASSSRLQNPQKTVVSKGSLQTPQKPLASSGSLQTPQMLPGTTTSSPLPMKPKLKSVPTEPSKEYGYQKGPKEVMVLKVTGPFTYAVREEEQKIIHATVATEDEFFRVKVFDITFKDKFTPRNIIAISNYFGRDGFLEIYKTSSVSNVSADRKMEILSTLIHHAKATPKIRQLWSQNKGSYVNGIFTVCKKRVRQGCIFYDVKDSTGMMEVVVYGRLANVSCEEGDRLNLTCFEVATSEGSLQLRSVLHSHLKVTKAKKSKAQPPESDSQVETSLES